jgi:hypothetical protein
LWRNKRYSSTASELRLRRDCSRKSSLSRVTFGS